MNRTRTNTSLLVPVQRLLAHHRHPHPRSGYTAPQQGWWKISYIMQGSAGTNTIDITTWQVDIRGNPVHPAV